MSARDDGLMAIPLSSGVAHEVEVRYRWTWDEWAGLAASVGTGLVLVWSRRRAGWFGGEAGLAE